MFLIAQATTRMEWWEAVLLGVIEGLTEYLPVSSTGHLIVAQRLMGMASDDAANAYAICIQAGAIVAVMGLYRHRIKQMIVGLIGRDANGRKLFINVCAAFVPAAVIGFAFDKQIESILFGLWPIIIAWFIGGLVILAIGRAETAGTVKLAGTAPLESLHVRNAMFIGLAQCMAMWPGTSRSLVTIVAAWAVGLSITAAVEFSFLLGLITLGAATCYQALKYGDVMVSEFGVSALVIGFIAATISAAIAVKWFVAFLTRSGLSLFGWYRVAIAMIVGSMVLAGTIGASTESDEQFESNRQQKQYERGNGIRTVNTTSPFAQTEVPTNAPPHHQSQRARDGAE